MNIKRADLVARLREQAQASGWVWKDIQRLLLESADELEAGSAEADAAIGLWKDVAIDQSKRNEPSGMAALMAGDGTRLSRLYERLQDARLAYETELLSHIEMDRVRNGKPTD